MVYGSSSTIIGFVRRDLLFSLSNSFVKDTSFVVTIKLNALSEFGSVISATSASFSSFDGGQVGPPYIKIYVEHQFYKMI